MLLRSRACPTTSLGCFSLSAVQYLGVPTTASVELVLFELSLLLEWAVLCNVLTNKIPNCQIPMHDVLYTLSAISKSTNVLKFKDKISNIKAVSRISQASFYFIYCNKWNNSIVYSYSFNLLLERLAFF